MPCVCFVYSACTNVYIVQHTQWFVYVHTWWCVQTHETLLTTECRCHRCRVMGSAFVWYTCEHDISVGMSVLLGYKQPPPSLRRQHYHAVWYTTTELGQIPLSGCSTYMTKFEMTLQLFVEYILLVFVWWFNHSSSTSLATATATLHTWHMVWSPVMRNASSCLTPAKFLTVHDWIG